MVTGKIKFTPQIALTITLMLFALVATWYSVVIPVGEGVDEIPHFSYIRFVKENWELPVQPWRDNGRPLQVLMGHHPPLYYFIGALVSAWTDTSDYREVLRPNPHFIWSENNPYNGWNVYLHSPLDQFPYSGTILAIHYLRLWSVVMGLVTVLATYKIGSLLMPDYPWVVVTAAALVAFHPSFLFMSSTIHHDPLITMLFALSLWWLVRALYHKPHAPALIVAGVLLGASLITKLSGLSLVILFGLTLVMIAHRDRDWRYGLRSGMILYGIALVIAGWWYVRNQILYGDPLAWDMFLTIFDHMERQQTYSWQLFRDEFLGQLSRTFWGAFGYMHITLPVAFRRIFWALTGIAIVGTSWAAIRQRSKLVSGTHVQAWFILLSAVILVFISLIRLSTDMLGAGQGRYLLTVAVSFTLILAVGLHSLISFRYQRIWAVSIGLAMMVYSFFILVRFVGPLYPTPETIKQADLINVTQSGIQYGEALELAAYNWQVETIEGEQQASLALYWQALGNSRPDLYTNLRLRDRFGSPFIEEAFWPIPSSSTAVWDIETLYITRRKYNIPAKIPMGPVFIEVSIQSGLNGEQLIAIDKRSKQSVGIMPQIGILLIGQTTDIDPSIETFDNPRRDLLGNSITLIGFDLNGREFHQGEELHLNLFWQASEPLDRNFTVFVHILDEAGNLVAQKDNEPNQGQYPTSIWEVEKTVRDSYTIPLHKELKTGRYSLKVGMYEWPSLERQSVIVDGVVQGDAILLDKITIVK